MSKHTTQINKPVTDKARRFNWPRIFGYDFFISFKLGPPPIGSQSYASDLARRLRELDFTVFFSEEEAPPGEKLDSTLVNALHKSRILVVIANEGALLQSPWIRREVEEFRSKHPNHPVIPINVDHAIQKFGAQADAVNWLDCEGKIWLDENKQAIEDGITSPEILKRLEITPQFIRSNTRLRWTVAVVIFLLIGLTLWVGFAAWDANRKFRDATSLRLAAEGGAMTAGLQSGGKIKGLFKILAGHRLVSSTSTTGAIQSEYLKLKQVIFMNETPHQISSLAFSPNGNLIVSGGFDNTLRLWDYNTGQSIGQPLTKHKHWVLSVAFSSATNRIVSGSGDHTLILWDVKTGQPIGQPFIGHEDMVLSVAFSPDGSRIVSGSRDNTLRLWDVKTGQPIGNVLIGHLDVVTSVAFSPDGRSIVSGSGDKTLRLWNAESGKPIGHPLKGHEDNVNSVAFSPDGRSIVSGSSDKTLRQWDAESGQPIGQPLAKHKSRVESVAFNPAGNRIVSGGGDNNVIIWDVKTGQPISQPFTGHTGEIFSVAFSPDGNRIISGGFDNALFMWKANTDQSISQQLIGHHDKRVVSVAFNQNGNLIVSGSWDGTLRLWDTITGQPFGQPLKDNQIRVLSVTFSPDGNQIVSVGFECEFELWDTKTRQLIDHSKDWEPSTREGLVHLIGDDDLGDFVALSPNSSQCVAGGMLELKDAKTGKLTGKQLIVDNYDRATSVVFSPDGKLIVSGSRFGNLRQWNAITGQPLHQPIKAYMGKISLVAFSPNGKRIVLGSDDKTLRLWDVESGQPIGQPLIGHEDIVTSVAFSPDGHSFVSGSGDKTLRLWDTESGQPIGQPLQGHESTIYSVAFSTNGRNIVSGADDGTLRIWPVFEGWVDELCKKLGRNMSHKEWREWVSPDIDYIEQCPGLPVPPDESEATAVASKSN